MGFVCRGVDGGYSVSVSGIYTGRGPRGTGEGGR